MIRSKLLLGVALLALVACDDGTDVSYPAKDEHGLTSMMSLVGASEPDPSWSGAYLSARFAQDRFDWPRAQGFLTLVTQERSASDNLNRRLMLLAIGAGDLTGAAALVKDQDVRLDPSGLTGLVHVMGPLQRSEWTKAQEIIASWPKNTLTQFATPLLNAWLQAAKGTFPGSSLPSGGLYDVHRLMIADFMNDTAAIKNMAQMGLAPRVQGAVSPMAVERMGDIFARRGHYAAAAEFYRLTQTINQHVVNIGSKLAAAEAGRQPDHLPQPDLTVLSGISLVLFDMASSFYNDRAMDSALVFTRLALALDSKQVGATLLLGNILAAAEQKKAAIDIYGSLPHEAPQYLAVQQKIASLRVDMGEDDLAIATLRDLVQQDLPANQKIDYLMQIGDIERENENFKLALEAYDDALDLLPDGPTAEHWDLLYARGMTLERLKRWKEAEKDLQAALAFQPDHPYIMNYLGYSWADQGQNLDQAMDLLKKAVAVVPDDGYVTDSVGWAYYRLQKWSDAIDYLERAVELLPYDPTVNDHLGDAYWQNGRKREARFQWQRALNYSEEAEQKAAIQKKLDQGI